MTENKVIIVDDIIFVRRNIAEIKMTAHKENSGCLPLSKPVMLFLKAQGVRTIDFTIYEEQGMYDDVLSTAVKWANEWVGSWGGKIGKTNGASFGYIIGWAMTFFFSHTLQTYLLLKEIIKKLKPDHVICFTSDMVDLVKNPVKLSNTDPYLISKMLSEFSLDPNNKFTLTMRTLSYADGGAQRKFEYARNFFEHINTVFSSLISIRRVLFGKGKKILFFEGAHHFEDIMDKGYLRKYERVHLEKTIGLSLFFRMYLKGISIVTLSSHRAASGPGYFCDKSEARGKLYNFFMYKGDNLLPFLWPRLEYILTEYFPNVVCRDMNAISEILSKERPDMVVAENDTTYLERLLIILAKSKGINTAVIQHGATLSEPDAGNKGLMVSDFYPVTADIFFAFGKMTKDWFLKMETEDKRIVVTGGARFDRYYSRCKTSSKSRNGQKNVLLLLNDLWIKEGMVTHYIGLDVFYSHISEFIKIAKRNSDLHFIIRPHDVTHMWNEIFRNELLKVKNIEISRQGALEDVFRFSSLVAGYSSTALVEALICGIPILSIDTGEFHNILPLWEYGLSIRVGSFQELESQIKRLVYSSDENEKALMSMASNIHLFNYNNDGRAAERISSELDRILVVS